MSRRIKNKIHIYVLRVGELINEHLITICHLKMYEQFADMRQSGCPNMDRRKNVYIPPNYSNTALVSNTRGLCDQKKLKK